MLEKSHRLRVCFQVSSISHITADGILNSMQSCCKLIFEAVSTSKNVKIKKRAFFTLVEIPMEDY